MAYDNTNSGALFRNRHEGGEDSKRPEYSGTLNVEGHEYWISAWVRESKKGTKFMSLSVRPKEDDAKVGRGVSMDDSIPFAPEVR